MSKAISGKETSFAHIRNNTHQSWWRDPSLRINVLHCVGCCLCPFYLGYDQSLLTGLQAIPSWASYFGNPKGQALGLIAAMIFLPAIVLGYIADAISMRFGRRILVWAGSVLIIGGAIFQAVSQNRGEFMGSRAMIGAGGAIVKVGAPVLIQELAHPRYRAVLGTMYYCFYHIGSTAAACLSIAGLYINGDWGWRLPCLLQVLGPVACLALTCTIPESPRWLAKNGKYDQARSILVKYHANGDDEDDLVAWEYGEIIAIAEQDRAAQRSSYLDFLKTPGNRKRLWINVFLGLGSNWVGNGIVGYYLAPVLRSVGITDPVKITGLNAGLSVWNFVSSMAAGVSSERVGRRPLWITSNAGMGCTFAFIMGFSAAFANTGKTPYGLAVIPFLFIFNAFYGIAWIALNYSYSVEIVPFALRSKGLAIYICFNNLGNAFNQFANPIALEALAWRYYAVYIAIDFVIAIIIYFTFPETRRLSIEEISLLLDFGLRDGRQKVIEAMEAATRVEPKGTGVADVEGKPVEERIEGASQDRKV